MQSLNIKNGDLRKIRRILRNRIIGRSASWSLADIAAPGMNRLILRHTDPAYVSDSYRRFIEQLGRALADKSLKFGARLNNLDRFDMDSYHRVRLPDNILFINRERKINRQVLVITNNRDFFVYIPDKVLVITPVYIHTEEYLELETTLSKKHVLADYLHDDHNLAGRKLNGSREVYSQWRAELRLQADSGFQILLTCKDMDILQSLRDGLKALRDSRLRAGPGMRFG